MLPNLESFIMGPGNEQLNFNLDLVWSQYTYEFPEQTWKAVSKSVSNVRFKFMKKTSLLTCIFIFFFYRVIQEIIHLV